MRDSFSLIPILVKVYRYCDHALKICTWLGYTSQIIFCLFFCNLKLSFSHPESDVPVGA